MLNEIDKESDGEPTGVRLFLNPADLALLKETEFFIREDIKLAPDESLSRGSMRAMMQDSIIENLTETRIQQVTEQLLSAIGRDEENGEYAQQHNEHESPDTAALISEMAIDEQPVLENEPELQPELEQELQTVLGAEITGEELESDGQPDEFDQ